MEWAVLLDGQIINVVTTGQGRQAAERVASLMAGGPYTVAPLDSLPERVKNAYRYWGERP